MPQVNLPPGIWSVSIVSPDENALVELYQGAMVQLGTATGSLTRDVSLTNAETLTARPDNVALWATRRGAVGAEAGQVPVAPVTARVASDGYWGPSARDVITDWQIPQRIVGLQRGQLLAMGRPAYLWLPTGPVDSTPYASTQTSLHRPPVPCTCTKNAGSPSAQADRTCRSCGGTQYVPGFVRHLHHTLWFSSADVELWDATNAVPPGLHSITATGISLDRTTRPFRVVLAPDVLEGTLRFEFYVENPTDSAFEEHLDAYAQPDGDTRVSVRYFADGTEVALPGLAVALTSSLLAVEVTLTRGDRRMRSPEFEVLRLRRVREEHENPAITARRRNRTVMGNHQGLTLAGPTGQLDECPPGSLLFLRPQEQSAFTLDASRGRVVEDSQARTWTTPFDFFDLAVTPESRAALMADDAVEPPFVEWRHGVHAGLRYALLDLTLSEQNLLATHQSFVARRLQAGEPQSRWW
jgi:hypothetical protein